MTNFPQEFKFSELPNGVKIVSEFIPHVQSFSLGFWVNIGTRDESPVTNGICHFIEHMLFKGTKNRTARQISETIESYGAYLNAFTSKEHTCFYGRGLKQHLGKTFDIIADMVKEPLFRAGDIRKESGVILDELYDIEDNPEELIFDKFEESIFHGNPLSRPIIGTERSIRSFTNENLHAFHAKQYNPKNLLIAASGNIDHDALHNLTGKSFSGLRGEKRRQRRIFEGSGAAELHIRKDISQVHCILGTSSYGYRDPKRIQLNLLSVALGEGTSSRLYQAVRERQGIAYQINSFMNSYFDSSAFGVYFSTNEKNLNKALKIISVEFKKLREKKMSARELSRVKEYLKGQIFLGLENTSNRMIRIAGNYLALNRFIPVEEVIGNIDTVTADDLAELSNIVLREDTLTKVFIRSAEGAGTEQ